MAIGLSKTVILLTFIEIIATVSARIINLDDNIAHEIIDNSIKTNTDLAKEEADNKLPVEPNVHEEKLPDNGVITGLNQQSFEKAVLLMKDSLKGEDVPCSMYDPPTPNFALPGRRISEAKCLEHIWETKRDEETQKRVDKCKAAHPDFTTIVGGRLATPGEFPHMGALGWKTKNGSYSFLCGSFLVSSKFVLTAAHCRTADDHPNLSHPTPKIIRFGVQNIMDDSSASLVDIKILRFEPHQKYKPYPYKSYDIAVVELAKRVAFNEYIQPACLLNQKVQTALITGWGVVDSVIGSKHMSDDLLAAEVDIVPSSKCTRKLRSKGDNYWNLESSQICAIRNNADTCAGDSGGPLQTKLSVGTKKTVYNVIGVTSFGFICGRPRFPSVYTRVSSYIDWIEERVWKNEKKTMRLEKSEETSALEISVNVAEAQNHPEAVLQINSRQSYISKDSIQNINKYFDLRNDD